MTNLASWSLFIDISLMCSLIYLAYRLTKAESVAVKIDKVEGLDRTLKKIISESEEASIELDQKLRERQRDLQTLLSDLRDIESQASNSFDNSKRIKQELERNILNASRLLKELSKIVSLSKQKEISIDDTLEEIESIKRNNNETSENIIELTKEAKSNVTNENIKDDFVLGSKARNNKQYVVSDKYARASLLSNKQSEKTLATQSPLASQIKKEVTNDSSRERELRARALERSYDLAEALIQRGVSIEDVALRTNLSLSDVRKIQKVMLINSKNSNLQSSIIKEQEAEDTAKKIVTSLDDERLGVLSKMRRQSATL